MATHVYLTYNDAPTGIYKSQVTDVCSFLQFRGVKIKLIALISFRNYFKNRQIIRKLYPNSIVLPMYPKPRNWARNIVVLRIILFFFRVETILARGPFATHLALKLRSSGRCRKVVFDARGAYTAEFNEFQVSNDSSLINQIETLEAEAIRHADKRLAVSNALLQYWREVFHWAHADDIVIPCTINTTFFFKLKKVSELQILRKALLYQEDDIIIVFSGSGAGWQSLDLLDRFLLRVFEQQPNVHLILLTTADVSNLSLVKQFPDRIRKLWLAHENVYDVLSIADYGWMVRDADVTNRVAAPVKFAEYLSAGLNVLVSEHLGDYSNFVATHGCGMVLSAGSIPELHRLEGGQRVVNHNLANRYFTKGNYWAHYQKLLS